MKKFLILAATLLFPLIQNNVLASTMTDETAAAHLTITLTGPGQVKSGDGIDIEITLKNDTKLMIRASKMLGGAAIGSVFSVIGPNGQEQPSNPDKPVPLSLQAFAMYPGDVQHQHFAASEDYDMTAPGEYTIRAKRYLNDGTLIAISNKLTVVVTK